MFAEKDNLAARMDAGFLNSLVGDYLTSIGSKLAEKFKKETKSAPLPPDSPSIGEMYKHYQATTPVKRKAELTNGHSAAKKAKKVRATDDLSDRPAGVVGT